MRQFLGLLAIFIMGFCVGCIYAYSEVQRFLKEQGKEDKNDKG